MAQQYSFMCHCHVSSYYTSLLQAYLSVRHIFLYDNRMKRECQEKYEEVYYCLFVIWYHFNPTSFYQESNSNIHLICGFYLLSQNEHYTVLQVIILIERTLLTFCYQIQLHIFIVITLKVTPQIFQIHKSNNQKWQLGRSIKIHMASIRLFLLQ